jgi:hypothetical protein
MIPTACDDLQESAADVLSGPDDERLLLLTAGVLSGACAMELRAVLLAASQAQRQRSVRTKISELHESASAMRTVGEMLLPRLREATLESSMAKAMVVQGSNVSQLARELEDALQPSASSAQVSASLVVQLVVDGWGCMQQVCL